MEEGLFEAISAPFRIEFPNDWKDDEYYDFKWEYFTGHVDTSEKITY